MRIDQLLPRLVAGDAISAQAAALGTSLRSLGHESDLYVGEIGAEPMEGVPSRPAASLDARADILLYHVSAGSLLTDRFLASPQARVVVFHNFTPSRFFEGWDPPMAEVMRQGVRELRRCAPLCSLAIGDSSFNRAELDAVGFTRTAVLPILVDRAALDAPADAGWAARLAERRGSGHLWLFVGRFAPNKCQADVVRAFAAYRRAADPGAVLVLIGSAFTGSYRAAVLELAGGLGLAEAVIAEGPVSHAALMACYRAADVFVCLSEHEGFCVPIVEAMHHRVPVVALAAGAVPETAGAAAVVLADKDPVVVAAVVAEVLGDAAVRATLVRRGLDRAEELSALQGRRRLAELIPEMAR